MKKLTILLSFILLQSCLNGSSDGSSNSQNQTGGSNPISTGSTSGGTTTGSSSGGSTGGTCYGNSQDGDGSGSSPVFTSDIQLPGKTDWVPVNGSAPSGQIDYSTAQILLNSVDSRLRVRAQVLSQPSDCPGRTTGSPTYPLYTKLRFKIRFYTLNQSTNQIEPTPFVYEPTNPVNVNSCSEIFDIPFKNQVAAAYATPVVMGVEDVRSDFECVFHGEGGTTPRCPAEKDVTSRSCWRIKLQWVTDTTDDFN